GRRVPPQHHVREPHPRRSREGDGAVLHARRVPREAHVHEIHCGRLRRTRRYGPPAPRLVPGEERARDERARGWGAGEADPPAAPDGLALGAVAGEGAPEDGDGVVVDVESSAGEGTVALEVA